MTASVELPALTMMSTRRGFSSAAKEFGNGFAAYEVALRTVFGQQGVGLADRLVVQRHGVSVVGEVPRHIGAHHRGAGDADLSGAVGGLESDELMRRHSLFRGTAVCRAVR